jgi:hypothetical protein
MAAAHTTSSPELTRETSAVEIAAIPELKTSAASAPSTAAIFSSAATIVGFSYREYRYAESVPSWYRSTSRADSNTNVEVS